MDSRIIIRTSKNGLFKKRRYQVTLNETEIRELNHEKNLTEFILPTGKYNVKIEDGKSYQSKDIILSSGQTKILKVNPGITYEIGLGLMIGIAIVTLFIQLIILEEISIPLMMISTIPLLFMRKRRFAERFEITYSTL